MAGVFLFGGISLHHMLYLYYSYLLILVVVVTESRQQT